jgi:hypothetical protein
MVTSFKDALLFFGMQIVLKMLYRPGCYENRRTVVDCNGPISTHKVLTQKSGVGGSRDSRCYDCVTRVNNIKRHTPNGTSVQE